MSEVHRRGGGPEASPSLHGEGLGAGGPPAAASAAGRLSCSYVLSGHQSAITCIRET